MNESDGIAGRFQEKPAHAVTLGGLIRLSQSSPFSYQGCDPPKLGAIIWIGWCRFIDIKIDANVSRNTCG